MQRFLQCVLAGSLVVCSALGAHAGPRPSAEMERLIETFEGRWTVRETHASNEWAAHGATGTGTAEFTRGPGSESLIQTYRSTVGTFAFAGLGVTWWNHQARQYQGIWCENTARDGCADSGAVRWEGDRLIADYVGEANGKRTRLRRTLAKITPNSFTVVIDAASGTGPLRPEITVVYERERN